MIVEVDFVAIVSLHAAAVVVVVGVDVARASQSAFAVEAEASAAARTAALVDDYGIVDVAAGYYYAATSRKEPLRDKG